MCSLNRTPPTARNSPPEYSCPMARWLNSTATRSASAAAFAAAEAERVAAELSHLAIGQLCSGGEFRAIGGVRFREHKRSIGCVAADREMLVTGDEDGNVFVRDFEPAHLGN